MHTASHTTITIITPPSLHVTENSLRIMLLGGDATWKDSLVEYAHQIWRDHNLSFYCVDDYVGNFDWVWLHLPSMDWVLLGELTPLMGGIVRKNLQTSLVCASMDPDAQGVFAKCGIQCFNQPHGAVDFLELHFRPDK